jgi:predicted AlkP superfamily pyrophosphatase or phosphodiesterase
MLAVTPRKLLAATLTAAFAFTALSPVRADVYNAKPKLVIILVLDQFRGDYLDRYRDDFKTPSGFNLFLNRGAYFTGCYYNYANTMTAPGHSTIGTGAYTAGHGIALNEWWDLKRSTSHPVSSVEDEDYQIVGDHTPKDIGTSPRNELASTLGDEVVLASRGESKLFGISLKDRAAILTSGHASSGAFWLDHASGHFVTSSYWDKTLPAWVSAFNSSGRTEKASAEAKARPGYFYDDVGANPASVSYLLDFAQALITSEKMGAHPTTDVLTISISSTDILGHRVGPDSPEQRAMIDATDVDLNTFFTWLDQHVDGGLGNVWIALTGDHGIGPTIPAATADHMAAATFDLHKVFASVETQLNAQHSAGRNIKYLLPSELPYITLDPRAFKTVGIAEKDAETEVARLLPAAFQGSIASVDGRLPTRAPLRGVYTKSDIAAGQVPRTPYGERVLNSYSPNGEWYVMITPAMYEQGQSQGTNHYTPWSYDRHVPLAFFGSAFKPGSYLEPVEPVDIATTFAALLRVNRPSAAVGHVLTFALKPAAQP